MSSSASVVSLFDSDSHDSLALRFTALYGASVRYCAAWGKWLIWDGRRWKPDTVTSVRNMARKVCRDVAGELIRPKPSIKSMTTAKAVEWFAQADPRHATEADLWDADPWLLNTPTGTVNLRTGRMGQNDPDHHITKITAAGPGGECPTWLEFLRRVTGDDADLQDFLKRIAGYALTGVTREHAMFFFYGTGGNGKGTFLNTLTAIMGDYATVSTMDAFTAGLGDRHSTELAMLRGARLVSAQETEEGRRWAESRIKAMTGGDPITARFMYHDFFTYLPQFKLVIAGNHKPGLRNVDEAIRRRFHLVPFTQTIPSEERDPHLPDKLKAEWPGILAWMIEGCREWQTVGLVPPQCVRSATDEYLAGEDDVQTWLDECCDLDPYGYALNKALYASWKAWADQAGVRAMSGKRLYDQLRTKGFVSDETTRQPGTGLSRFRGLRVRPIERDDGWWQSDRV